MSPNSPWLRLLEWDGSDEFFALCSEALNEVQSAHAHRLAQKIRNENPDRDADWSDGVDWAADLIDPGVQQ